MTKLEAAKKILKQGNCDGIRCGGCPAGGDFGEDCGENAFWKDETGNCEPDEEISSSLRRAFEEYVEAKEGNAPKKVRTVYINVDGVVFAKNAIGDKLIEDLEIYLSDYEAALEAIQENIKSIKYKLALHAEMLENGEFE